MPGLCSTTLGCPTFAAIYGGMAGVSILSRSCCSVLVSPSAPSQGSDPLVLSQEVLLSQHSSLADEPPLELPVEEVSISSFHAPAGQDSLVAPVLVPHGSLLGVPGRPLTLADFPPSSSHDSIESSPGEPYQRRFIHVSASPADLTLGPCAPIGIWPSALARKRTSPFFLKT